MRSIIDLDLNEKELRGALKEIEEARFAESKGKGPNYHEAKEFQNSALYTPAISATYIGHVERLEKDEKEAKDACDPNLNPFLQMNANFLFGADDLKFINPNSKLFFYPWVLYSAGQGAKTDGMSKKDNWVTTTPRDKRVVVLGDSGGYQIQQSSIDFDPEVTPERMLRWLERIADYSMILDFPTGGIDKGSVIPHVKRLIKDGIDIKAIAKQIGFSTDYTACLEQTKLNNDYFVQNRKANATEFLNVIQGRNEDESRFWYDAVKHYPCEGWAFAGKHSVMLSMTLRRLIQMRNDRLLKQNQFIHFLGVSTLNVSAAVRLSTPLLSL